MTNSGTDPTDALPLDRNPIALPPPDRWGVRVANAGQSCGGNKVASIQRHEFSDDGNGPRGRKDHPVGVGILHDRAVQDRLDAPSGGTRGQFVWRHDVLASDAGLVKGLARNVLAMMIAQRHMIERAFLGNVAPTLAHHDQSSPRNPFAG